MFLEALKSFMLLYSLKKKKGGESLHPPHPLSLVPTARYPSYSEGP